MSNIRQLKHTALEGKSSRGRINALKCRNEFGRRPDVRIIACVSQQTDGWNNSHKGECNLERVPDGKKRGPAWLGMGQGMPVFPDPSFYPSPRIVGNREWTRKIPSGKLERFPKILKVCQSNVNISCFCII